MHQRVEVVILGDDSIRVRKDSPTGSWPPPPKYPAIPLPDRSRMDEAIKITGWMMNTEGLIPGPHSSCSIRQGFQQHDLCWPHSPPPFHVTLPRGVGMSQWVWKKELGPFSLAPTSLTKCPWGLTSVRGQMDGCLCHVKLSKDSKVQVRVNLFTRVSSRSCLQVNQLL